MKEVTLQKISFKSYLKLLVISGFGAGIISGILFFIMSFIDGANVYVTIGSYTTTGIKAGVLSLVVCPIMALLMSIISSIFLYFGLSVILKFKKSIKLKIEMADETSPE